MVLRGELARDPQMLQHWRTSFSGDTPVYSVLHQRGEQFYLNPRIVLVNRESTSTRSLLEWMSRQMLNTRLYHPAWKVVMTQAFAGFFVLIFAVTLNLIHLTMGNWEMFAGLASALMIYWLLYFGGFLVANAAICKLSYHDGQGVKRMAVIDWLKLFVLIPMIPLVFFAAVVKAMGNRRVNWRGIHYQIKSPYDIELENYQPYSIRSEQSVQSL